MPTSRIFRTRWLSRFARREGIGDSALIEAVARAERGLIDADLGGGLIKQRVARLGQGRSGGYRMILAFRRGDRAVVVYGFSKNERENTSADELQTLRDVGRDWLDVSADEIDEALASGKLNEVNYGSEEKAQQID